jgi:hypothetical protein
MFRPISQIPETIDLLKNESDQAIALVRLGLNPLESSKIRGPKFIGNLDSMTTKQKISRKKKENTVSKIFVDRFALKQYEILNFYNRKYH